MKKMVSELDRSHYAIQLRGGGKLVFLEWDAGQGAYLEHAVPDEDLASFLWETVCLSNEVSLRDILLLVERDEILFSTVCQCSHIKELLDDMRISGNQDGEVDGNEAVVLEMAWYACLQDGLFIQMPSFGGRSANGDAIAVEFSPLADLADIPVVLNENFVLIDEDEPMEAVFAAQRQFTLWDLVSGVLSELTVFGSPADRQTTVEEIQRRVRDVAKGQRDTCTLEDIMEHAALQAEENRKHFPCRECGADARCACFGKPANLCHDCFAQMEEN